MDNKNRLENILLENIAATFAKSLGYSPLGAMSDEFREKFLSAAKTVVDLAIVQQHRPPINPSWKPENAAVTAKMTVPDLIRHIYKNRVSVAVAPDGHHRTPYVSTEEWHRIYYWANKTETLNEANDAIIGNLSDRLAALEHLTLTKEPVSLTKGGDEPQAATVPRSITSHLCVSPLGAIKIEALDLPGAGGASHEYEISGFFHRGDVPAATRISFQNGPIPEAGVNGITNEALLAIVADRLASFQAGPFPSERNGMALEAVKYALEHLHKRTLERMSRGVEGKAVK